MRKYFKISKFLYQTKMAWFSSGYLRLINNYPSKQSRKLSAHMWKGSCQKHCYFHTQHKKLETNSIVRVVESVMPKYREIEFATRISVIANESYTHLSAAKSWTCCPFLNSVEDILTWNPWSNWSKYGRVPYSEVLISSQVVCLTKEGRCPHC